MTDLNELTDRVAQHLAGAPVKLRWQNPVTRNALAESYKTTGGYVIDIAYVSDVETRFKLYLHECAHCRLGHPTGLVSGNQAPGSVKRTEAQRAEWREDPREAAANELADAWKEYAAMNAWRYPVVTYGIEAHLKALLTWQPEYFPRAESGGKQYKVIDPFKIKKG